MEADRAMRSVIRFSGDGGGGMTVYRCRFCQDFHFGHDNKRQTRSITGPRKGMMNLYH